MDAARFAEKLGQLVAQKRKSKGLSREALSAASQASAVTIQRLEGGKSAGIGFDMLLSITQALDISIARALLEEEQFESMQETISSQWHDILSKIHESSVEKREWIARIIIELLNTPKEH